MVITIIIITKMFYNLAAVIMIIIEYHCTKLRLHHQISRVAICDHSLSDLFNPFRTVGTEFDPIIHDTNSTRGIARVC